MFNIINKKPHTKIHKVHALVAGQSLIQKSLMIPVDKQDYKKIVAKNEKLMLVQKKSFKIQIVIN